jgi:hypothetical protein
MLFSIWSDSIRKIQAVSQCLSGVERKLKDKVTAHPSQCKTWEDIMKLCKSGWALRSNRKTTVKFNAMQPVKRKSYSCMYLLKFTDRGTAEQGA